MGKKNKYNLGGAPPQKKKCFKKNPKKKVGWGHFAPPPKAQTISKKGPSKNNFFEIFNDQEKAPPKKNFFKNQKKKWVGGGPLFKGESLTRKPPKIFLGGFLGKKKKWDFFQNPDWNSLQNQFFFKRGEAFLRKQEKVKVPWNTQFFFFNRLKWGGNWVWGGFGGPRKKEELRVLKKGG